MAEQNKIEAQLPLSLYTDTEPEQQPDGTYSFAVNAVHDSSDGSMGSLVNEQGNIECVDLPGGESGKISMGANLHAVLTDDGSISIFDSASCTLEVVVDGLSDLNLIYPLTGEFRIVRGCERVIYWRDSNNPDRFFNFDRPDKFQDDDGNYNPDLFNLNYRAVHPTLQAELFPRGGKLPLGNYFFSVDYLDDFENVLFTSLPTVDYVAVADDDDGGLNIETNLAEVGGVPLSNNSVDITVSNIPDEISYIRLNVIRAITGDGLTVDAHSINVPIIVSEGTANYTYTGYDPQRGDLLVDYRGLIAKRRIYASSDCMVQVQGRLVRGGLRESVRNYSSFQRAASKICVKYICEDVNKFEAYKHKTELGGEVRAYGVVYVFSDGTVTDEFHIPGPAPVEGSDQESSLNNCVEVFVSDVNGSICPGGVRYVIEYTLDGQPFTEGGIITDFTAVDEVVCAQTDVAIEVTRFEVSLITEDAEEFGGCLWELDYRIVEKDVTEGNWRFLSTAVKDEVPVPGFASSGTPGFYSSGQLYTNPPNYEDCNELDYWGEDCDDNALINTPVRYHVMPDRALEPLLTQDGKVRLIGVDFDNIEYPHPDIVDHYIVASIRSPFTSLVEAKGILFPYTYSDEDDDSNVYTEGRYLHNVVGDTPQTRFHDNEEYLHNFLSPEYLFLDQLPQGDVIVEEGSFTESKAEIDQNNNNYFDGDLPYDDLDLYQKKHEITGYDQITDVNVYQVNDSYNIDRRSEVDEIRNLSYSSRFNIITSPDLNDGSVGMRYVSLKRDVQIFQNVFSIRYRRISSYPKHNTIFNGDAFISPFSLTNLSWVRVGSNGVFDLVFSEFFGIGGGDTLVRVEFEYFKDIVIESTVNPKLRHSGTDICNQYYDDRADVFAYIKRRISEQTGTEQRYKLRDSLCGEWYGYNSDYSRIQDLEQYTPLPYTWDYCSPCTGLYLNTITWSEKSFQDDRADNYRVYLPNNIKTITANKGDMIAADYKDDKIVLRTQQSCFFLRPNPQQLQTSDEVIYIGTGDFLSLDPQEINVVDMGWGGQLDVFESINTDYGLVWVDRSRGKIFLLAGGIDIISNRGMFHWLQRNLQSEGDKCILAYDPEFERLIVTRKSMFTLSYDLKRKAWVSWHSYKPDNYLSDTRTLLSEYEGKIWKHQSSQFHNFYGVAYPFTIEYIVNEFTSLHPDSIYYYVRMLKWDGGLQIYVEDQTADFDRLIVYNKNQSTGEENLDVDLNGLSNIRYTPGENIIEKVDDMSKISRLMDKSIGDRIFQPVPFTANQGYTDKIPLDVDDNMAQVKQGFFNGKFLAIRLTLDKTDYKCIVNLLATLKHYHNR